MAFLIPLLDAFYLALYSSGGVILERILALVETMSD